MIRAWSTRLLVATLAAVAIGGSSGADAQTVGVLAGSSWTGLDGGQGRGSEAIFGVAAGGNATFPISRRWRIRMAALYTEKGAERPAENGPSGIDLAYFELPVLGGFELSRGAWSGGLYAGPAFSFETSCHSKQTQRDVVFFTDCDKVGIDTKNLDVGVMFGTRGAYRVLPRVDLTLDVLFNLGLGNIDDRIGIESTRNRAIVGLAGISFDVGVR